MSVAQHRLDARFLFGLAAMAIVAMGNTILHSTFYTRHTDLFTFAVAADFLLTIPLLYWLLLVRTKKAAPTTLLPVFLSGVTLIKFCMPESGRLVLQPLLLVSGPLEAFSLGWLIYRVRQPLRQQPERSDRTATGFDGFLQRTREVMGETLLTELVLTELSVAYYGIVGWFVRYTPSPDTLGVTTYKKSGWGAILCILLFLIVLEGSVVHLLLAQWNPYVAWFWTAGDLYVLLWLLADFQAMRLQPIELTADTLIVRLGLRWRATVPTSSVVSVDPFTQAQPLSERTDYLRIAPLGEPDFVLTLREPVPFLGLLGKQKIIRHVGILADDPALRDRLHEIARQSIENPS